MIKLVIFGCVHIGAKAADVAGLQTYLDMLKDKDTYGLVVGDTFENAIVASGKGMVYEQSLSPGDQLEEGVHMFRPYADKFIGACTSNHSRRSARECGIDIDKQLWERIGRGSIYKGLQGVVNFQGKTIAFAHGGGSGDNWTDAKKLFAIYPTADIVVTSHRHEMQSKWFGNYTVDRRGSRKKKFVLFVRTGGLMDWAEYAQEELYTPQKSGFSVLYFPGNGVVRADTNGL